MSSTRIRIFLLVALLALLAPLGSFAQEQQPPMRGERDGARGDRLMGAITAIQKDSLTIQDRDGASITVRLTPDTRFRRNRQDAKLSDFKVGDHVFIAGDRVEDHTFTARMVGGGDRIAPPSPEEMVKMGLGTRFVVGEVKSIDGTNITVLRPDNVQQTFAVDENTSFRDREGESITLGDVKVGDQVGARGEMKGNTFVATTLRTGMQFLQRRRSDAEEPGAPQPAPDAPKK